MIIYYLNTKPEEEEELKNLGAYKNKKNGLWGFSQFYPNPQVFAKWQSISQETMDPVSITSLCKLAMLPKDGTRTFLEKAGYLEPGTTNPTESAIALGVVNVTGNRAGEGSFTYAVYPDNFAQYLSSNRAVIEQMESEIKQKKEQEKQSIISGKNERMNQAALRQFQISKFKKLAIPDNAVVIDTETTGLSGNDEVVELAIVDLAGNVLYNGMFRPWVPMGEEARKVNNISDEMLVASPDFSSGFQNICNILYNRPVIAHNVAFDAKLLKQTADRHMGAGAGDYLNSMIPYYIDSKKIAKEFLNVKSFSLDPLCQMLGMEGSEAHRAVDDCNWVIWLLNALETRPFEQLVPKK